MQMRRWKNTNTITIEALGLTIVILVLLGVIGSVILLGVTQQKKLNSLSQEIEILQKEASQLKTSTSTPSETNKLTLQKELLRIENNKINSQSSVYGTLAQVLGGAFFFITAYLSLKNLGIAEQTLRTTEEKQVTEHFSKAVEYLTNTDRPEIQLGGIYALDRISKDSRKDYWAIMEILASFVRSNSPIIGSDINTTNISSSIQAALISIGQRDRQQDPGSRKIDLSGIYLAKIHLKNVDFSGAELNKTDLRESYLSDINLSFAKLKGAKLCNVNRRTDGLPIRNINFSGAILIHADLTGANFTKTNFKRATLDSANLSHAILADANFSEAKFIKTDLRNTDLSRANFSKASLQGANLEGANLQGAVFLRTQITAEQLRLAKNWQSLDKNFLRKLGLYSDNEKK